MQISMKSSRRSGLAEDMEMQLMWWKCNNGSHDADGHVVWKQIPGESFQGAKSHMEKQSSTQRTGSGQTPDYTDEKQSASHFQSPSPDGD